MALGLELSVEVSDNLIPLVERRVAFVKAAGCCYCQFGWTAQELHLFILGKMPISCTRG